MPHSELKDFKQRFEEGEFAQSAELSTRYLDENILIFDNIKVLTNPDPVRLQMNIPQKHLKSLVMWQGLLDQPIAHFLYPRM